MVPAQIAASKTSNVVVMYASAYGNTAALAQAISRGVVKSGVAVNTVNLEVTPLDDVVAAVKASDGFTIGSPTLGGHMPTPVQVRQQHCLAMLATVLCSACSPWHVLTWGCGFNLVNMSLSASEECLANGSSRCSHCCADVCWLFPVQLALGSILRSGGARELPCGVFGSFGWSGEAVDEMESKLEDGGYGFAFKPIKVKFKPTTKVTTAACTVCGGQPLPAGIPACPVMQLKDCHTCQSEHACDVSDCCC